ncbi:MlaC/ttg2D family ABC transporter substrate-binding protein [Pelistega ratti]|uniref:MlaC/ttg2D family ABC transporter substrate-binding protein n=1 Tax=Pelistega ratti TaxID=2652177 RepID=UPI0013574838|nr:ABC transporter substrate-binding protein [Pelistega ratti]
MSRSILHTTTKTLLASTLGLGLMLSVQAAQDPNQFVEQIANNTLDAVRKSNAARNGDIAAINKIVDQYLLPSANLEKTTRLATGAPWRQATAEQKRQLVSAFKNTLIRTYSGAFKNVTDSTKITLLPFRGDANANDVVVYSHISGPNGPVAVNYRLEKSGNSWKVYDFNVENIWMIQNYKNQFSAEINKGGIDGLIKSLQK